ncbi:MAG: LON peptidase substrate-binding domain-containing protein [Ignavibacteriaceae bacterium]|nr:LON peptidase substrate-binding domain-containing protein [Ignavibacterium sp.]MCC6254909.1 LON peptidase substrate-binding domain-containing protein [Ignavibacteriaceae bacterium]HRN27395.1 LON peptidase substrate-binding domain-containing protein [Ignavibacteriaceae bacterium]HRP94317.1 LON peptidase substrate-binding domain-containing protein [Ignavibacteriaceae bacterium]HRQ55068.1 LON peptidase substrate-binding domain-containing protein [Ignavibacteriaceae bacterium]
MTSIPIFPLNLVVFPDSKYPLHIFEERYKILLQNCLTHNSGFGIVASIDKRISDVGVYVKVSSVLKTYLNGELDIVVQGIERFLINSTSLHLDGYYIAEVEKYLDDDSVADVKLMDELQTEFEEVVELANYKLEDAFWSNLKSAKLKSYKIAEKSGLTYEQQQELLILKTENERLNYLINYFVSIKDKVDKASEVKKIIMNDGYLN